MNSDNNQFTFLLSSNPDYEKMVIYINSGNNEVAILNCDDGLDKVKIELLDRFEDKVVWTFECQAFIEALKIAYEKLKNANE